MNDNIKLIDMINRLRNEVSSLDTRLKNEKARNAEQARNLTKLGIHVPSISELASLNQANGRSMT